MNRYLKYSLILHSAGLVLLILGTWFAPKAKPQRMELIVLPKGTSLDAVLTRDVVEAMQNPNLKQGHGLPAKNTPEPSPEPGPEPTPTPSPEPTPRPEPTAPPIPKQTPAATPEPTPRATPRTTPKPTPTPKPSPTSTPRPKKSPTPKPEPTKKPDTKKDKPKKDEKKTAKADQKSKPTPKPTPKQTPKKPTPKPSPTPLKSAYDLPDTVPDEEASELADAGLPRQTPANAQVVDSLAPGQTAGVPGVAEGVEGAPLPLDRNQSMLSMLYTNRVKLLITRNFTVPPGVDDPELSCVVEWEIRPDGAIQNVRVQKSSGVPQLDACAVDALRTTANVGMLPPEFGQRSVWTSLTFFFSAGGGAEQP